MKTACLLVQLDILHAGPAENGTALVWMSS